MSVNVAEPMNWFFLHHRLCLLAGSFQAVPLSWAELVAIENELVNHDSRCLKLNAWLLCLGDWKDLLEAKPEVRE
jgi:hypothetical protein